MDWRCEWCGKPHEENDPPCDNCGHGTFEEAVVRQTDLSEGDPQSTTVWVCTECGRSHTKHAPPCSRCGNHKLVREEQRFDESELSTPSYLDLLTPRYVAGLAVVLALVGVFALGAAGVVDIPGFGNEIPEASDVPGNATSADGISLPEAETAYVDALAERRSSDGAGSLDRTATLDEIATYLNQRRVKAEYTDADYVSREQFQSLFEGRCDQPALLPYRVASPAGDTPSAVGEQFLERIVADGNLPASDASRMGVDVHAAPDGAIYFLQVTC